MSAVETISGPSAEPISRDEAKAHLRVQSFEDDALIDELITAAREWIEADTGRDLVLCRRRLVRDAFPALGTTPIRLRRAPTRGIVAVYYKDTAGTPQTWPEASYQADMASLPARLLPAFGVSWPTTQCGRLNAVEIVYRSGHLVPFAADTGTGTLSAADHPFADGDMVRLSNSGGLPPAPLDTNADYHVVNATATTVQLALTVSGEPIELTTAGSGLGFLGALPGALRQALLSLVAHLYEHREAAPAAMPPQVAALIAPYRVMHSHG
ncbi:MAG: head-tail connector protein [Alphaproteobacteria bacterium]